MHTSKEAVVFVVILFFTLAVFFGLYSTSASNVFALVKYKCRELPDVIECCALINGKVWCTLCDKTEPPSGCTDRFPGSRTVGGTTPPTNLAPPKVCPDGSQPDANGVCPPVTQGTPPLPPSKGATGAIKQPPTNLAPPQPPSTSQTTTCPDGSSPDANGVCPHPTTTGNQNLRQEQQQQTGGTNNVNQQSQSSGPANLSPDNNNPTTGDHEQKGSHLGQLIGGESASKKGNNDNSPTPPPCPKHNSDIPPNCTLKPKF